MNQSRLEQLLAFLKEDPQDPFNIYAVATEYAKTQPLQALIYYEELLKDHEMYVPTYYHAARLYIQLGFKQKAKDTFEKGLTISLQQGKRNAHRELQNAYNEFLEEEEG